MQILSIFGFDLVVCFLSSFLNFYAAVVSLVVSPFWFWFGCLFGVGLVSFVIVGLL